MRQLRQLAPKVLSILVLLTTPRLCRSTFLSHPALKWTHTLEGAGGVASTAALRKGNAVVTSRDGRNLYATTDDGAVHILQLTDGEKGRRRTESSDPTVLLNETGAGGVNDDATVRRFVPRSVDGRYTLCESGISLHETVSGVVYAVYAVIDVPIVKNTAPAHNYATGDTTFGGGGGDGGDSEDLSSRVIAVNPDGTLRWEVTLGGYISGTPIIGHDGDKIYVSQNIRLTEEPSHSNIYEPDSYRGKIKVIRDNNAGTGEGGGVEIAASKYLESRTAPYGPLSVRTVQIGDTRRDVVVFAENRGGGHVEAGRVYVMTPSDEYDLRNGRGNGAYDLKTLSKWSRSTVTRPTFSEDGKSVCMGGIGSLVACWGLRAFITSVIGNPLQPEWETKVGNGTERNDTQPLRGAAVLSADAQSLFVAGASTSFYSLDASSGKVQWEDMNEESVFMAEPKFNLNTDSVLYAIEHLSGKVYQYDAATGDRNWEWDCKNLAGVVCQNSVEAEFSLSPDGNLVFFGDIFGKIVALQVAEFTMLPAASGEAGEIKDPVSEGPTTSSTTVAPTAVPILATDPYAYAGATEFPTATPVFATDPYAGATALGVDNASSANGKAGLVAGLLTGIAVILALLLLVLRRKRKGGALGQRKAEGGDAAQSAADNEVEEVVPRAPNKSVCSHSYNSQQLEGSCENTMHSGSTRKTNLRPKQMVKEESVEITWDEARSMGNGTKARYI